MVAAIAVRPTGGPAFAQFCRDHIRHTKGRFAGTPLELEEWQQAFFDDLLEIDPATGLRVYSEALLGLPRKNGKSTIASSLMLYLLTMDDEPGPEVYAAAAAKDQANIVFRQARQFVAKSPTLSDWIRARRWDMEVPDNDGLFKVLSSDAPLQHGLNPSGVVIDELWAHENGDLYEALTTGSGARDQPLTVAITTSGFDEETVLGTIYNAAMASPLIERPTPYLTILRDRASGFLMYWYGAPDDADVDDPAVWAGVNPASWLKDLKYLRRQRTKPSMLLASFKRLHLNMWTAVEAPWIDPKLWDACLDPGLVGGGKDPRYPLRVDLPLGVGVDMGETYDSTGVCYAQAQPNPADPDGPPLVILRDEGWDNPYPPNHKTYNEWQVNTEEVRQFIRELGTTYPLPQTRIDERVVAGPAIAYDPWHFGESAQMLRQEGMAAIEWPQNATRMIPASETILELVKTRRLVHDGSRALRQHVLNAVAQQTTRGWRIAKGAQSKKKIDRLVGGVMAIQMALLPAPRRRAKKSARVVGF